MFNGKKTMELIYYTPASVKTAGIRLIEEGETQKVTFYSRKLIVALARTILAMQPKDEHMVYQAISSYSSLYPLISAETEFGFDAEVETKVRDFLLATRTGELAPAMSYLFAQEQLAKPFVLDFRTTIVDERLRMYPDLVAADLSGELVVIDSKGSREARNKGKLREALIRSEEVGALAFEEWSFAKFYALFISVTKTDKQEASAIHYTYTQNEQSTVIENKRPLIYQHYASWFMLLGYEKEAKRLALGKSIKLKKLKKTQTLHGQTYVELEARNSLFFNTLQEWDDQFETARFWLSKSVLNYLLGAEELDLPKEKHVQKVKATCDLFADGVAITYKN